MEHGHSIQKRQIKKQSIKSSIMSVLKKIICGFVLITFTLGSYAQIKLPAAWQSSHIQISKEGILTYIPDKKGNLIPILVGWVI